MEHWVHDVGIDILKKKQVLLRDTGSGICTQSSLLKLVTNEQSRGEQRSRRTDQVTYRALGSRQSQKSNRAEPIPGNVEIFSV